MFAHVFTCETIDVLSWPVKGKQLVRQLVEAMRDREAEEVVLEAEVSNAGALALYESLGFIRDKRLQRCAFPPSSFR